METAINPHIDRYLLEPQALSLRVEQILMTGLKRELSLLSDI
uniref:Uncharacterized protein n=1 Tax=Anguilla anguilla TaxID=7936 RepID=A0A0E9RDX0_ANGAN